MNKKTKLSDLQKNKEKNKEKNLKIGKKETEIDGDIKNKRINSKLYYYIIISHFNQIKIR